MTSTYRTLWLSVENIYLLSDWPDIELSHNLVLKVMTLFKGIIIIIIIIILLLLLLLLLLL